MFQNVHVLRIYQNIGVLDILKREYCFYFYNPNIYSLHNQDLLKNIHNLMSDFF